MFVFLFEVVVGVVCWFIVLVLMCFWWLCGVVFSVFLFFCGVVLFL